MSNRIKKKARNLTLKAKEPAIKETGEKTRTDQTKQISKKIEEKK